MISRQVFRGQRGQSLSEYLGVTALVAVAGITVIALFGGSLQTQFGNMAREIAGSSEQSELPPDDLERLQAFDPADEPEDTAQDDTSEEDVDVAVKSRCWDGPISCGGIGGGGGTGGAPGRSGGSSSSRSSPAQAPRSAVAPLTGIAKNPKWITPRQGVEGPGLRDHFRNHGEQVGARTVREYNASARQTIQNGRRFTYRDRGTGEPRVGYYDAGTGLFTATSQTRRTPRIHTHFPTTWESLRRRPGFSAN